MGIARRRSARLGMVLLALGGGCGDPPPRETDPPAAEAPPALDPAGAEVGDSVLGLRIVALDVRPSLADSAGWAGRVEFEGAVTLSGEIRPHPAYPDVQDVCFFPDAASAARLPRFPGDERTSWLCFVDGEGARRSLGPGPAGHATVTADRFVYHFAPTDVHNTARLVRVEAAPG